MSSLAEIQEKLQADILSGSTKSLDLLKEPATSGKSDRLNVYKNAYLLRLTEILGTENPVLFEYMGDTAFREMARHYFSACPSKHPNARYVSNRLAEFLQTDERYLQFPLLSELAAMEYAIEWVFDCPDTPTKTMEELAALPPDRISELRLAFAGSVRLLATGTNAFDVYRALKAGNTPPDPETAKTARKLLIWRQDLASRYREPDAEEIMLLEQAMAEKPFATLCEMAAVMDDPENAAGRVAGYLTHWINSGMIARFIL